MQGFVLTQRQNRNVIGQYGVRRNGNIRFSGSFDAKNVDAKLSADIQLTNAFPDPRLRHLHFKDGVLLVDLYVVENMVGSESDRCPFCHLFFRVDYMVCAVAEQKLCLHITLGTWFREYLYIPLGGSRCSRKRMIFNLLVVWLATGLWHGAHLNFLLWGLGLFAVLVVEKLWLKKYLDRWPILGHLYMLVLIPVSWAVFSVSDFGQLGAYFGRLFPLFSRTAAAYPLDFLKYGKTYGVFLILGLLCSTSLPAYLYRRFKSTWVGAVILAVLFWLCLYCLSKGMNDPFMYFRL